MASAAPSVVEAQVGVADEFKLGEMKEVKVGEVIVLVGRSKSGLFACGYKCPHYGAGLVKGVISEDHVRCPWHGACFSVKTGDIEEAPSLDAIPVYPLRVDGDKVFVSVPQTPESTNSRRHMAMCKHAEGGRTFVVLGGGAAGANAVESLRQNGFTGRIVLATDEAVLPYDRIKLSKNPAAKVQDILLRPAAFYQEHHIEVLFNKKAVSIDSGAKTIKFQDGTDLHYDELLVCTGARARTFPVPGHQLGNIFTIRKPEDVVPLAGLIERKAANKWVIIGSGFVGMEILVWLESKGITGTVVIGMESAPLETVLGPAIGQFVKLKHEAAGTKFVKSTLKAFEGKDQVTHVLADSGDKFEADAVIFAVGAAINTEFLRTDPKVELSDRGEVVVDQFLRNKSGIYAAGDIALFPLHGRGERVRIEHWDVAMQQGRIAARNMAGHPTEYVSVPFFWTAQFGPIRYCGYHRAIDEIIYDGDVVKEGKCTAFYCKDGKVHAVCTVNKDPVGVAAAELFGRNLMPTVAELRQDMNLLKRL